MEEALLQIAKAIEMLAQALGWCTFWICLSILVD